MKVKCQASCAKCYHETGRTQEFDANDLVWFCTSCKKHYLCDIGMSKGQNSYSCSFCGRILIEEEVDKSIIAKKSVLGKKETDLYHQLMGSKKEEEKKKKWWKKSKKQAKSIDVYEQSQISEICDHKGLTVPLILEFTKYFKIKNPKNYSKITKVKVLIQRLSQEDPTIIPFLYSSLVKLETNPHAFEIRFAVFYYEFITDKSKIIVTYQSPEKQYCDIKIVDSSGNETWIYCVEENMDIDNLEKLAEKVFAVDFKHFPKVKKIFLVAKSFSYLAKGLITKYQSILIGIDSENSESFDGERRLIPLSLWQAVQGKIKFQNVSFR